MNKQSSSAETTLIKVDVIIAVYNAETTIEETVRSAMHQIVPDHLIHRLLCLCDAPSNTVHFDICICCYNDASTDGSFNLLESMMDDKEHVWNYQSNGESSKRTLSMQMKLLIGSAPTGTSSRGAGYARNQAVKLRDNYEQQHNLKAKHSEGNKEGASQNTNEHYFLCILDSDDIMHPTRIAEQTFAMLSLSENNDNNVRYEKTLMGCQFDRIPQDSTRHYTQWANSLEDERLYLEQFRECTLVSCSRYCIDVSFVLDVWYQTKLARQL